MKKLLSMIFLLTNLTISAQQDLPDPGNKILPDKYFEIAVVLLAAWAAITVIMTFIKTLLDNRLKVKMIEKGISEDVIKNVLQTNRFEAKQQAFKWFLFLFGISAGLFAASLFPAGIFSIGIVLLAISICYLIYYYYLKMNKSK